MTEYANIVIKLIKKTDKVNINSVKEVSKLITDCIKNDGIIYMFGCGHSALIAQDCFYRAGGLANIQPIFVPELMLHISASNSSALEKNEKNAKDILNQYPIKENDLLFVFSVSGINGVPIEVAKEGREKGLKVIGMGSSSYKRQKSRHSSKKHLSDYSDVFLDNCVPKGDTVLSVDADTKAVPVSTVISSFLIQSCIYGAFLNCIDQNISVDFFGSGNLPENKERNAILIEKFKQRIKFL